MKDAKFCKAVLEGYLDVMHEWKKLPGIDVICFAYEGTFPSSPLRRLLVRLFIIDVGGHGKWFGEQNSENFPADFLRDLVSELLKQHTSKCKAFDLQTLK
jgi:hypothetical protein